MVDGPLGVDPLRGTVQRDRTTQGAGDPPGGVATVVEGGIEAVGGEGAVPVEEGTSPGSHRPAPTSNSSRPCP